jgi:hypothetical protein
VLTAGLPSLPDSVVSALLIETGRWPLLLRLVNRVLLDQSRLGVDAGVLAREVLQRLRHGGALQIDRMSGRDLSRLDLNDPDQRDRAAATVEVSAGLLGAADRDRLAELSIFAADETVPVGLDGRWLAVAGGNTVRIWDMSTRRSRLRFDGHPNIRQIVVGPDGTWLLTCGDDSVRMWDACTGRADRLSSDRMALGC